MYTPSELEQIPKPFEKLLSDAEMRIMEDIVRRIAINGEVTRAADWQIYRLNQLGESRKTIDEVIKRTLSLSDKKLKNLYEEVIESGYAMDEKLYKATGTEFVPFKKNQELQQIIESVVMQTKDELKNITQTTGFAVRKSGKLVFTNTSDYLQNTLDGALTDIATGALDYNTAINRVVQEITSSGLRTVDYATGWSNRVNVAARRAVMTGVKQVTGKINDMNAKALNTDYFEVTWHGTARPSHQEWQGKVYTSSQLVEICGLGSIGGLNGVNCYHSYYPFVPGVSERTYTDEQLEELNAKENAVKEYKGKEYTSYEASQRMRELEAHMRAQRERIKLLGDGKASEQDIINAKSKYRAISQQYTDFAKQMGLPQERARVYIDGLKNVL